MGFDELCRCAKTITNSIGRVLDLHDLTNHLGPPVVNSPSLKEVLELVNRWTQKDYVAATREDMQADPTGSDHIPAYYLLKRDPLLCGLLLYNFNLVAHAGAIVTAN